MRKSILIVLLLTGCMTAEKQAAINQRTDEAFDICARTLTPGSEDHFRCVERMVGIPKAPERTFCRRDSSGNVRCVTR